MYAADLFEKDIAAHIRDFQEGLIPPYTFLRGFEGFAAKAKALELADERKKQAQLSQAQDELPIATTATNPSPLHFEDRNSS